MTFAEKRMLVETQSAVGRLSARVDALVKYVEAIEQRRRGRPSQDEAEKLEQLRKEALG